MGAFLVPGNGISSIDNTGGAGCADIVIGFVDNGVLVVDEIEVKVETEDRDVTGNKTGGFWIIGWVIPEEVDGSGSVGGNTNDLLLVLKIALFESGSMLLVILDERRSGGLTGLGNKDFFEGDVLLFY